MQRPNPMTDTPELRPCPWPGCDANEDEKPRVARYSSSLYFVFAYCGRCHMEGPKRDTYEEAAAAWNELPRVLVSDDKNLTADHLLERARYHESTAHDLRRAAERVARLEQQREGGEVEG